MAKKIRGQRQISLMAHTLLGIKMEWEQTTFYQLGCDDRSVKHGVSPIIPPPSVQTIEPRQRKSGGLAIKLSEWLATISMRRKK